MEPPAVVYSHCGRCARTILTCFGCWRN